MKYVGNKVEGIKIAYIGGGSRGWAWGLMSDLIQAEDISGDMVLYDIDFQAAKENAIIGNKYNDIEGAKTHWNYMAVETIEEALTGADFVIISILPGTFDEMESDVHTPEKYGIYQSVGDTSGPGGIVRAMRTLPIYEEFALKIKECCPEAWVINYTNPMTLCVKSLYQAFPEIKAFGCCHEVFGTQKLLARMVKEYLGEDAKREDIKVNPVSVNHFTWLTEAKYKNVDLFPYYAKFCVENAEGVESGGDDNWMNSYFKSEDKVKMELFRKYGWIAAAGDRHLAEFCPGDWYLQSPEQVEKMHFSLTPVSWRKDILKQRNEKRQKFISGEMPIELRETGEEGVNQIRALLGLGELVTNVNIPNRGQVPNMPLGAILETNAVFRAGSVTPVFAGDIPTEIYPLVSRIVAEQEAVTKAIYERDLEKVFVAFANDPLVTLNMEDARKLFDEMVENTKAYLTDWNLD